jgi:hypothetical protein
VPKLAIMLLVYPTSADIINRLALKTAKEKVKNWSEKCALEMGVFTLTFYGYTRPDGRIEAANV